VSVEEAVYKRIDGCVEKRGAYTDVKRYETGVRDVAAFVIRHQRSPRGEREVGNETEDEHPRDAKHHDGVLDVQHLPR